MNRFAMGERGGFRYSRRRMVKVSYWLTQISLPVMTHSAPRMDAIPNLYSQPKVTPSGYRPPLHCSSHKGAHSLFDHKQDQNTYLAVSFQANRVLAASVSL